KGPPTVQPGSTATHTDLAVAYDLATLADDPEGAPLFFRVFDAQHGTASLGGDGHTVIFLPDLGFAGEASFTFQANDGFLQSTAAGGSVNVNGAPLINLDFRQRLPRLDPGQKQTMQVIGDFADETGVALPASYLTFTTFDPALAAVSADGTLRALS